MKEAGNISLETAEPDGLGDKWVMQVCTTNTSTFCCYSTR